MSSTFFPHRLQWFSAAAAVRAFQGLQAAAEPLLPAAINVHANAIRCFEQAQAHLDAGRRDASREALHQGVALIDLLKRSVLPHGDASRDLVRVYDYLARGLSTTSSAFARENMELACQTLRALTAACESRRGSQGGSREDRSQPDLVHGGGARR